MQLRRLNSAFCCLLVLVHGQEMYDYIIAGGGTAGLVIANRLSADPSISVAVIESGTDERNNPNVTSVLGFLTAFNTPIDWAYELVPQEGLNGRPMQYHAGKALGGTSTINGMTYIRGDVAEIDAWESLGNKGWNWDNLWPHYKAVEKFQTPTEAQVAAGASWTPSFHGNAGELAVSYPYQLLNGSLHETWEATWKKWGLPLLQDPNGGDVRGISTWPQTLDRDNSIRADSARSFLQPIQDRPNLTIIQGTVKQILWKADDNTTSSKACAEGVEYFTPSGESVIVAANKEIILSAGAIRSPLILEMSGIGHPSILENLGIKTKINLPGVGENLLEQPLAAFGYSGKISNVTGSIAPYAAFINAADTFGAALPSIAASTKANLSKWAAQIAAANGDRVPASALEKVLEVQHSLIFEHNVTTGEILTMFAEGLTGNIIWPLLPFSRGSVHLRSAESADDPLVDPKYLFTDFDVEMMTGIGKVATGFFETEPISGLITGTVPLGDNVLPPNATNEQWETYLRGQSGPNHHALGTAAMMSRELGGVVDPALKVYGTNNLRIVDASIIPLQISGHLTATIYAVADRASDIILGKILPAHLEIK